MLLASRPLTPTGAAKASGSVSGVLLDAESGAPLAGRVLHLGGKPRVTSRDDGRFLLAPVETGVYRLIVSGACDGVPERVEVRPEESVEVEVRVDTGCAHPNRFYAADELPPGSRRRPWPVVLADGVAAAALDLPSLEVVAEATAADSSLRAVIAAPHGIRTDLRRWVPTALPRIAPRETDIDARSGGDWVALILPGCFSPRSQLTITADGSLLVRLLGGPPEDPGAPLLRRRLCVGCVEGLFADLRQNRLPELTGLWALVPSGIDERTLAGVIDGEPFLIRTNGLKLALVEVLGDRMLDLAAYRGCIEPGEMKLHANELEITAPDTVATDSLFDVRVVAWAPETLVGAVLRLDVEGARAVRGELRRSGVLDPGAPLVAEGSFRVLPACSWERGPRTIEVVARFAAEGGVPRDPLAAVRTHSIQVR
jgi:hypothetical protein